jgi:carnitine-CoA ligase
MARHNMKTVRPVYPSPELPEVDRRRYELPLPAMTVTGVVRARAEVTPEAGFVRIRDRWLTYAEALSQSTLVAAALTAAGVGKGDFCGQFMSTRMEFIANYLAMSRLGVIMAPINTAYRGYLLEYVLADTGCRLLFTEPDLLDRIAAAEPKLDVLETVVVMPGADASMPKFKRIRLITYEEFLAAGNRTAPPAVEVTHRDPNCIIYTSGTTGPSKGVLLSNSHAVSKALEVAEICRMDADDVIYSPLPLFHSMALQRGVLAAVVMGAAVVLRDRFSATAYWDDVREVGATVGHCVFSIPVILKKAPPNSRDSDNPLRCMYNAAYDAEFEERFGVKLIEGYGMTEANTALHMRYDEPARPGSCGKPNRDWEVRLVDEGDSEVPVGVVGEVTLRPCLPGRMMLRYHNKPEATLEAWRGLWFHTGDLAVRDSEGYHYFRDRKKDAIRRRGENISSWEVERILTDHPAILEAAAMPQPSDVGEDDLWVIVVPRPGATLTPLQVLEFCEVRMPDFMIPRYIEVADELLKTPTGRVEKYRLRERGPAPGTHDAGDRRRRR